MVQMPPNEQARFDQIDTEIREYVLGLVKMYRNAENEHGQMAACQALMIGLLYGGGAKTLSIAMMAISLLAQQESNR